jgi:hypothetical protein
MLEANCITEIIQKKGIPSFLDSDLPKIEFYKNLLPEIKSFFSFADFTEFIRLHHSSIGHFRFYAASSNQISAENFIANSDMQSLNPLSVLRHIHLDGGSILFGSPELLHDGLSQLSTLLSNLFQAQIQLLMFYTPPSTQTFAMHWDEQDVFIMQIYGTKKWTIGDVLYPKPLFGQRAVNLGVDLINYKFQNQQTFDLEVGDCLYLSRGVPHQAHSNEGPSLHLSIGINDARYEEKARLALQMANAMIINNVDFRKSFNKKNFLDQSQMTEMNNILKESLLNQKRNLTQEVPGFVLNNKQLFENYKIFLSGPGILPTTNINKCIPYLDYNYDPQKRSIKIQNKQHTLTLHENSMKTLEFIRGRKSFNFEEMQVVSGLSMTQTYLLLIKLVEADLLTIFPESAPL